jgi:hypothetical protein
VSPDALHDFLAAFHDDDEMTQRPPAGAWIPAENAALQALSAVNTAVVHRAVAATQAARATLDLDATVIESHKRDALPHYHGRRGYQPTAVLWAEQDLVVADQFRDGNVPAGMHTLEVARRAVAALPGTVRERAFRGDSACYDEKLLRYLVGQHIAFTISADMTVELRRVCAATGVTWMRREDRVTETVDVAEVEFTPGNWPKSAVPLRYLALRIRATQRRAVWRDPEVSRRGDQPVGGSARRVGAVALGKGGDDRVDARCDEKRPGRRGAAQWQIRRECGVVSTDPAYV